MRLGAILLTTLAGYTTSVVGDWLETEWECDTFGCGYEPAYADFSNFHTDFGSYWVDASDGCHDTSVPGMTDFCVDWKYTRGHFKFSHQDFKRCFQKNFAGDGPYDCHTYKQCWHDYWPEVACTW